MKSNFPNLYRKERTISTITLAVALEINAASFNYIKEFAKEASENEYITFTHYNFFYSYPCWGKEWPNNQKCQFHRLHTKCHLCQWQPDRNRAGIGHIYLLNNGVGNPEIWIAKGYEKINGRAVPVKELVKNTPQLSRMILLCPDHIKSHSKYQRINTRPVQLKLF